MTDQDAPSGSDRVSLHDATFLRTPPGGLPFNVGGLVLVGGKGGRTLRYADLVDVLERRIHDLPRFRKRLWWPTSSRVRPQWVDDGSFDLARHLVAEEPLPIGDTRALADLVARRFSDELDPDRPLWRFHLVPDPSGGSAALLLRASHALFDGMSGIEIARVLLDRDAEPPGGSTEPWSPAAPPGPAEIEGTQWAEDVVAKLRRQWLRAAGRLEVLPALEERIAFLDGWISMLERPRHGMPRFPSTGAQRLRYGFASLDQTALRDAARRLDVKLEELLTASAAGGLGRLLEARRQAGAGESIRTMVPVALPRRDRRRTLGNAASFVIVALPLGPMAARDRLEKTVVEMREARASGQERTTARVIEIMEGLPIGMETLARAAASSEPYVDAVVSFVRGPRRQLYLAGYPHVATHPVLPISPSMRLSIGFAGLGSDIGIGVTADAGAIAEVDFLVDGIIRTARELAT